MRQLWQRLFDGQPEAVDMAAFLSDAVPSPESVAPGPGVGGKAVRNDHKHPRMVSSTMETVSAGSTAQAMFTYRTVDGTLGFVSKPGMVMTELEGDTSGASQPAIFKVQSWVVDGVTGRYTGAIIKVWRAQTIPTNLVTLLLGGVFNLFNTSVVGTAFSVVAVARSDV